MELRRLEYFIRVAELGSLGRASDVLRIAQPALTRQMRLLEEELNVTLFNRSRRGMQLTEEGEQLLAGVVGPLRQVDMTLQSIRSLSSKLVGNIVLGMPPTTTIVLARPLMQRIAAEEPSIQVRIVEGPTPNIVEWIRNGEVDIALLYAPLNDDRLVGRDLLREALVLVGSPAAKLSPQAPINFIDLMDLPLIIPNPRNGMRTIIERVSARYNKTLRPKCIIDSLNVTKSMVRNDDGYAMLPLSAVLEEVEAGTLTYCPIDSPFVARQLMMVRRRDTRIPRIITTVERFLQAEILQLNALGRWPAEMLIDGGDLS
jgi:LysR family nitrogen assimilation transcriptional regulator